MKERRLDLERLEKRLLLGATVTEPPETPGVPYEQGTPVNGRLAFEDGDGTDCVAYVWGPGQTTLYDANGGRFDDGDDLGRIEADGNGIFVSVNRGGNGDLDLYGPVDSVRSLRVNGDLNTHGKTSVNSNGNLRAVRVDGELDGDLSITGRNIHTIYFEDTKGHVNIEAEDNIGFVFSGGDLSGNFTGKNVRVLRSQGNLNHVKVNSDSPVAFLYGGKGMTNVEAMARTTVNRGDGKDLKLTGDVYIGLGDNRNVTLGTEERGYRVIRSLGKMENSKVNTGFLYVGKDANKISGSSEITILNGDGDDISIDDGRVFIARGSLYGSDLDGEYNVAKVLGDMSDTDIERSGFLYVGGNAEGNTAEFIRRGIINGNCQRMDIRDGRVFQSFGKTTKSTFGGDYRLLRYNGAKEVDFDETETLLVIGESEDVQGNRALVTKAIGDTDGLDIKYVDVFIGPEDNSFLTLGSEDNVLKYGYFGGLKNSVIYGDKIGTVRIGDMTDSFIVGDVIGNFNIRNGKNSTVIAGDLNLGEDRRISSDDRWYESEGENRIGFGHVHNPEDFGIYSGVLPETGTGTFGNSDIGTLVFTGNVQGQNKVRLDGEGPFGLYDGSKRKFTRVEVDNPYETPNLDAMIVSSSEPPPQF